MKARLAVLLVCLIFCTTASGQVHRPLPLKKPDVFFATIGGFDGPNYTVELKPDGLHYESTGAGSQESHIMIHPSAKAWARFMRKMNEVRLKDWAPSYYLPILDGTEWKIRMQAGAQEVESAGSNCYPKDGDEAHPSKTDVRGKSFNEFCQALAELVGRKFN